MHLLADENLPGVLVNALRVAGHDVIWIREVSPGIDDASIIAEAGSSGRIILTFDKDFGELVFRQRSDIPSGIILLRLPDVSRSELAHLIPHVLSTRDDWEGHFSVITRERIRMVPLR